MKPELILTFFAPMTDAMFDEGMNDYTKVNATALNSAVMIQPRYIAEESEGITRHPIPYTLLLDETGHHVFMYRRGKGVGESRLSGNASVGVGGHVDITPLMLAENINEDGHFDVISAIYDAAEREIDEEVANDLTEDEFTTLGVLVDNSDAVGRVHIGWILTKSIKGMPQIDMEEEELESLGWKEINSIDVECPELQLESWSKIAIEYLQTK